MTGTPVYLEVGTRRVFAAALDWPGWCRSGKTEVLALAALGDYAQRYAAVAEHAAIRWPKGKVDFTVVERLAGDATTDFGAPGQVPGVDNVALSGAQAKRIAALVSASWTVFDRVVAGAPAELRKGPRGGGRDRDPMVAHVWEAEAHYARKIGLRLRVPALDDAAAVAQHREAIVAVLRSPPAESLWPARYAARRIAWHVLDHAWEIEDRS